MFLVFPNLAKDFANNKIIFRVIDSRHGSIQPIELCDYNHLHLIANKFQDYLLEIRRKSKIYVPYFHFISNKVLFSSV